MERLTTLQRYWASLHIHGVFLELHLASHKAVYPSAVANGVVVVDGEGCVYCSHRSDGCNQSE